MITEKTARELSRTYREIEAAEKLLTEVDIELAKGERIGWRGELENAGRRCELAWPTGEASSHLYNVEPPIARAVLVAHIADQKAKLEKLNEVARLEVLSA